MLDFLKSPQCITPGNIYPLDIRYIFIRTQVTSLSMPFYAFRKYLSILRMIPNKKINQSIHAEVMTTCQALGKSSKYLIYTEQFQEVTREFSPDRTQGLKESKKSGQRRNVLPCSRDNTALGKQEF